MIHPTALPRGHARDGDDVALLDEHGPESPLCWREIVQLAVDGAWPCDQRLEDLLDRVERRP